MNVNGHYQSLLNRLGQLAHDYQKDAKEFEVYAMRNEEIGFQDIYTLDSAIIKRQVADQLADVLTKIKETSAADKEDMLFLLLQDLREYYLKILQDRDANEATMDISLDLTQNIKAILNDKLTSPKLKSSESHK